MPACASLIRAITVLREVNRSGAGLPKSAPTGFVRQRWAPYVLPGGIRRGADQRRPYGGASLGVAVLGAAFGLGGGGISGLRTAMLAGRGVQLLGALIAWLTVH